MLKTPLLTQEKKLELKTFMAPKHPGSICVANYKGGVGKTTLVCLVGYFLKKVLMFDIGNPVFGIEEGTMVRVDDGVATVLGKGRVKVFLRGEAPRWYRAGERLP